MDFDGAWGGGCMAPVSPLGAVVSWEEDDSGGEVKAVLGHSTSPTIDASVGVGMVGGVKAAVLLALVLGVRQLLTATIHRCSRGLYTRNSLNNGLYCVHLKRVCRESPQAI